MSKSEGFTVMELLITLAITGILSSIAYPSYRDSLIKIRRADGISAILAIQVAQEKFRGSCRFYAQTIDTGDVCGATAAVSKVAGSSTSADAYYTISIEASSASGNSYTIVATPTGTQADDTDCNPMKITFNASNPNGLKTPADCW